MAAVALKKREVDAKKIVINSVYQAPLYPLAYVKVLAQVF
jgi:hypothetical protein